MKAGGNTARDTDWPGDLLGPVSQLPAFSRLWVAFSGGLDSAMLLQVAASCHPAVTALHITHQLQPNHPQTDHSCRRPCDRLRLELVAQRLNVEVKDTAAGGAEAAARAARYDGLR